MQWTVGYIRFESSLPRVAWENLESSGQRIQIACLRDSMAINAEGCIVSGRVLTWNRYKQATRTVLVRCCKGRSSDRKVSVYSRGFNRRCLWDVNESKRFVSRLDMEVGEEETGQTQLFSRCSNPCPCKFINSSTDQDLAYSISFASRIQHRLWKIVCIY